MFLPPPGLFFTTNQDQKEWTRLKNEWSAKHQSEERQETHGGIHIPDSWLAPSLIVRVL